MTNKSLKKIKLPDKPGVYFFKKGRDILYIGKATSLRDRVKSYFGKDLIVTRGPVILDMVFKADKLDWIVADSVLEALILEANLIKKYQPKYNTKEKSDKSFNYVCITKEELPKVVVVRGKELREQQNFMRSSLPRVRGGFHTRKNSAVPFARIFGPYPNGSQLIEALKIVRKIFPFLDEKSKNYIEFYKQINLAPDLNDKKIYKQNVKNIILFFEGKKKKILKNLEKEMKEYAKNREFEKAGEVKRQIFALKHINDVALIKYGRLSVSERTSAQRDGASKAIFQQENMRGEYGNILPEVFRIEAYDIAHLGGKNMVGVMTVVSDGEKDKNEYRKFKIKTQNDANDTAALGEVLERRLAHTEWPYPKLIVVDGSTAQINAANKVLRAAGVAISVVAVVKNERHKPQYIKGDKTIVRKYEREILLANSEAHRFAIAYHKNLRNKNFLK